MATITAQPNQSMLDLIIQATGSLEAGGQWCRDNNVALSDVPVVGTQYIVSAAAVALGDAGVVKYLAERNIVPGTLGVPEVYVLVDEDGAEIVDEDGAPTFG